MALRRSAALLACSLLLLTTASALADGPYVSAPTGAHEAGRASDTGHGGVLPSGGYATSLPLDLPPPRGGLPLPIAIQSGSRGVGAAGLGWDVPLSYVHRSETVSRRRPQFRPAEAVKSRETVTVSLAGSVLEMIPSGAGTWVARRGARTLLLRLQPDTSYHLDDGEGRQWVFEKTQGSFGALPPDQLRLLTRIDGQGSANRVELRYEITHHMAQGTFGTAIDLKSIRYNFDAATTCAKHQVVLHYADRSAPAAVSFLDGDALLRMRLLTGVDVTARKDCGPSVAQRQRGYELVYAASGDADTQQPRLESFRVVGRDGTPEATQPIPISTFAYGRATNGNVLDFHRGPDVAIPPMEDVLAATEVDGDLDLPGQDVATVTRQNFLDITCDGRPDFVYLDGDQVMVAVNEPSGTGDVRFRAPTAFSAPHPGGPLEVHGKTIAGANQPHAIGGYHVKNHTWRKFLDWNADGCLDFVVADELENTWVVYLNTSNVGPAGRWARLEVDVTRLRQQIQETVTWPLEFLPLSASLSFSRTRANDCLARSADSPSGWVEDFSAAHGDGGTIVPCQLVPPSGDPWHVVRDQDTYTLWETGDVNGDGYPDLLRNSQHLRRLVVPEPTFLDGTPAPPVPAEKPRYFGATVHFLGFVGPNDVLVHTNVAGVRGVDGEYPFSEPAILFSSADGVQRWNGIGVDHRLLAGFLEVNGDGLLDRVIDPREPPPQTERGPQVLLNRGDHTFGSAGYELPAALRIFNAHPVLCPAADEVSAFQLAGLRDFNGDGVPDFYQATLTNGEVTAGRVQLGTGTGFGRVLDVETHGTNAIPLVFSHSLDDCQSTLVVTNNGVYDIDGDGIAEMVHLPRGATALETYHLSVDGGARLGVPEAGRLTQIDSPYGARTKIRYESAKRDWKTRHQLPFPEIVVTAVETVGLGSHGTVPSTVLYAYGDSEQFYDPVIDAFVFAGYGKRVELVVSDSEREGSTLRGTATLTLSPTKPALFDPTHGVSTRFARYVRVGQPSSIRAYSGGFVPDPTWILLANQFDVRLQGETTYEYGHYVSSVPVPETTPTRDCMDWVAPHNPSASLIHGQSADGKQHCAWSGFTYVHTTHTWRGAKPPPSLENVQTQSTVVSIDALARPLLVARRGDLFDGSDDTCVATEYAEPVGARPVRGAVASRKVLGANADGLCGDTVLASERTHYDGLAYGQVGAGRPTRRIVDRIDGAGTLLEQITVEDREYDPATGNPLSTTRKRAGVAQKVSVLAYDPFGLMPTKVERRGDGLSALLSQTEVDAHTLEPLEVVDANGTRVGGEFDGYGRPTRSSVTVPGGQPRVVGVASYEGFAVAPFDRRIVTKKFLDPVPESDVGTAAAMTIDVELDELGRPRWKRTRPGVGEEWLVTETRYDALGRVAFASDPRAASQPAATAYGTSYHFTDEGDPRCVIRGRGAQPLVTASNETTELYPTCFGRSYADHVERVDITAPDALLAGSSQAGVVRAAFRTALGRTKWASTYQGSTRLEHAALEYDRLGQLTAFRRFAEPVLALSPVSTEQSLDSLGNVLELREPETATRQFEYSAWGELTEMRHIDASVTPSVAHSQVMTYDSLGRLVGLFEQANGAIVPGTTHAYLYDEAVAVTPQITAAPVLPGKYLLGRLAATISPGVRVHYGYDAFGRVDDQTFSDGSGFVAIQRHTWKSDGRRDSLEMLLPDTEYESELVRYAYDDVNGDPTTVRYQRGSESRELFRAEAHDAFGRLRVASFNEAQIKLTSDHADLDRRLPKASELVSDESKFALSLATYDPLTRELERIESRGALGSATTFTYDALGRLASTRKKIGSTLVSTEAMTYDALGNLLSQTDSAQPSHDVKLSYRAAGDRDRVCDIHYGPNPPLMANCVGTTGAPVDSGNVRHDAAGNVVSMPVRGQGVRQLTYFGSGAVKTVTQAGRSARFSYDAAGDVQSIDIEGAEVRSQRSYGPYLEDRQGSLWRHIPGPSGALASRKGANGRWAFPFAEERGSRVVFDEDNTIVHDLHYAAFGDAVSTGSALPGESGHASAQWNGGEVLDGFSCLVQLGARLYDPCIGRFLQPDPLLAVRSGATTNKYAFALNDPQNLSDPSGLDSLGIVWSRGCVGAECHASRTPPFLLERCDPADPARDARWAAIVKAVAMDAQADGFAWLAGGRPPQDTLVDTVLLPTLSVTARAAPEVALAMVCPKCELIVALVQASNHDETVLPIVTGTAGLHPSRPRGMGTGGQGRRSGSGSSATTTSLRGGGSVDDFACSTKGTGRTPSELDEVCFTEETSIATDDGAKPIADLAVGDRVRTLNEAECEASSPPPGLHRVHLRGLDDHDQLQVVALRDNAWLEAHDALPGAVLWLELPELGYAGQAVVDAIHRDVVLTDGPGCLVSATFSRLSDGVRELGFEGADATVRVTGAHPFFSIDRQAWTAVAELAIGERVRTAQGELRLAWAMSLPGEHRVFNLEVADAHTYFASANGLWVHNNKESLIPARRAFKIADNGAHEVRRKLLDRHIGCKTGYCDDVAANAYGPNSDIVEFRPPPQKLLDNAAGIKWRMHMVNLNGNRIIDYDQGLMVVGKDPGDAIEAYKRLMFPGQVVNHKTHSYAGNDPTPLP
jgi:RHS repeat-associated protein